jgi:hypothetical protein
MKQFIVARHEKYGVELHREHKPTFKFLLNHFLSGMIF